MMLTHTEMILRIVAGALLGGIIGLERDIHGRPVGLRTHLIVAMASATFMVVSNHFVYFQHYGSGDHVDVDPSRIASTVVSGIGFLAGGAILKTGATVHGLTTAAGLWLVTSIGLCSGAGMYIESVAVTLMGLIALTFLRLFEDKDDKSIRRLVSLTMQDTPESISAVMSVLSQMGISFSDLNYDKKVDARQVCLSLEVRIPRETGVEKFIQQIEQQTGVLHLNVKLPD